MKRKAIICIGLAAVAVAVVVAVFSVSRFIRNDDLNATARSGDLEACRDLVSKGADVNGKGMHAMAPIMSAAKGGHPSVVDYLISAGADVNSHNDSGSALMWAIDSQNEQVIRSLLSHGANPNWRNHMGETALDHAIAKGLNRTEELLRQKTIAAEQDVDDQSAAAPKSNLE